MIDDIFDVLGGGEPRTPADGAALAAIVLATGPRRPGAGVWINACTVAVLDAGLSLAAATSFLERMLATYVSVYDKGLEGDQAAERFGAEFIDAMAAAIPDDADAEKVIRKALPRYTAILRISDNYRSEGASAS